MCQTPSNYITTIYHREVLLNDVGVRLLTGCNMFIVCEEDGK